MRCKSQINKNSLACFSNVVRLHKTAFARFLAMWGCFPRNAMRNISMQGMLSFTVCCSVLLCFMLTVGRPSRYQNNHDLFVVVGHCPGRSFYMSPAVESC